jgi:hypothetical protein
MLEALCPIARSTRGPDSLIFFWKTKGFFEAKQKAVEAIRLDSIFKRLATSNELQASGYRRQAARIKHQVNAIDIFFKGPV